MPGFDGTGPMGAGPMTGGGRGMCTPSRRFFSFGGFGPGRGFGPGFGRGRGYGKGFGRRGAGGWYGAAYDAPYGRPYAMRTEEELSFLRNESHSIQEELDAINTRIKELEPKATE